MRREEWLHSCAYRGSFLADDTEESLKLWTQTRSVVFSPPQASGGWPKVGHSEKTLMKKHLPVRNIKIEYLLASSIGLAVAFLTIDHRILLGDSAIWRAVGYDQGGGLAVFRYFINENWSWPLLVTKSIGLNGVGITLTDSNALLAILAKSVFFFGISAEKWWGLWILFIYVMQPASMVYALRSWGAQRRATLIFGSALSSLIPFMLFRVMHPALAAHFVILLALALAGRLHFESNSRRIYFQSVLLVVCSFLIHPYLGAMTALITAPSILQNLLTKQGKSKELIQPLALFVILMTFISWQSDYFGRDTVRNSAGSIYNSTILAPVTPLKSEIWSNQSVTAKLTSWEGYAYLGFGALLVLIFGLTQVRRQHLVSVMKFRTLFIGIALVAAIAITTNISLWSGPTADLSSVKVIYWSLFVTAIASLIFRNAYLLVTSFVGLYFFGSQLVSAFTDSFRANGRFMWIISYCILLLALVAIDRHRGKLVPIFLALSVLVQLIDTRSLLGWPNQLVIDDSSNRITPMNELVASIAKYESVHLLPPMVCLTDGAAIEAFRDVIIASSIANVPVDANYAARPSQEKCLESNEAYFDSPADPAAVSIFILDVNVAIGDRSCIRTGLLTLCTSVQ